MEKKKTRLEALKTVIFSSPASGGWSWNGGDDEVIRFQIEADTKFDLVLEDERLYVTFGRARHEISAHELVLKLLDDEIAKIIHSTKEMGYGYGH